MGSRGVKYLLYSIGLLLLLGSRQTTLAQTNEFRKLHEKLQHAKDSSRYVKTLNDLSFSPPEQPG